MVSESSKLVLFGESKPWFSNSINWTAVDDRVRGGSSQSYLDEDEKVNEVRFHGTLDTTTLGGAGFASQATTGNMTWDLNGYDGLEIIIDKSDGKMYTLIVKDYKPGKRDDGREMAGVNWEYDFVVEQDNAVMISAKWSDFKPTYRGREKGDAEPIKTGEIYQFSIMMRSFFEKQQGDFNLTIESISAYKEQQ